MSAALALGGELSIEQLQLTGLLLPAMLIGLALSRRLAGRLRPEALRPFVLGFSTVAGLIAAGRGIAAL